MKIKKGRYFILIVLLVPLLLYVWYAHASIYWKLGKIGLHAPSDAHSYLLGNSSSSPLHYVAIGDSLTSGVGVDSYTESYPYILAQDIARSQNRDVMLVPFAIPGIRSSYVRSHFVESVIEEKPDIVTLFIGVNDIHGNVSRDTFRENYEAIIQRLTTETTATVYLVNLPYIGTPDLIDLPYRYYFMWRTREFNEVIESLAAQYNLTYIDLYTSHLPDSQDTQYYAEDFFHPNALGYARWAQTLYANIYQ